jgi:tripartite-type tricarboxylate transporter receptor subunit TctC
MTRAMWTNAAAGLALVLLATPFAQTARSQAWPTKPIRLLVPFPPGASADLNARLLAPKLTEQLKQPVLVENRPGAAGIIAMEVTAKSPPDGTTALIANPTLVTSPFLFKMSFEPMQELAPVIWLTRFHYVLLAKNGFAANTVAEILALAREQPGKVTCASGGGMSEFGCGLLRALGRADITQVRYKGNAPAMNDLAGGQVDLLFDIVSVAAQNVKNGRARALATTGATRLPPFTDLPAIAETLPGYEVFGWQGVVTRAGTPREIIERLNQVIGETIQRDDVRPRLTDLGVEITAGTPEQFAEMIARERVRLGGIIREFNIRVE